MPDYQMFGGILRSELDLLELAPCGGPPPRWTLTRAERPAVATNVQPLGTEPVDPGVTVTLSRADGFFRLVYTDTGTFDISADGSRIRWTPPHGVNLDAARKDVLGRVLAVCLELQHVATLHGSAVQLADDGVAFLAPKFHGKSTTAAALVDRGARLLADDLVAVTDHDHPHVLPAVPVVQLWNDSAERVGRIDASQRGFGGSPKAQIGWDADSRNAAEPVPFAAVYLLAPFAPSGARRVRREQLPHFAATLALLGQTKIGALLGPAWRGALLERLSRLASLVPVYRLEVPRDYARLDELTDALMSWHEAVPALAEA
ncbi:MAG TPA: hypothetical protein VHB25_07985 [Gemmatimonadaceae bacterium]|nr:hypothetical protein [Gemmatimonadaceae bacterium]